MNDLKALCIRWFDEVWNKGRLEAIDEMFAPDGIAHGLAQDGGDLRGAEGFKAFHAQFKGAFPDIHIKVEDMIQEGDKVAVRFSCTGTHQGDQLGVAPTGRRVSFTGMSFTRWRNGQIVDGWNNVDFATVMQEVGVLRSTVGDR
jgi:steroid delta-isomerase-like uncharacterized protein